MTGIIATIVGASAGLMVASRLPYKPWSTVTAVVVGTIVANLFIPW